MVLSCADGNVIIEAMTSAECKNGGEKLVINYSFQSTPFGDVIIASTEKGVCYLGFVEESRPEACNILVGKFPKAKFFMKTDELQHDAMSAFMDAGIDYHDGTGDSHRLRDKSPQIRLHLNGTSFQLSVWKALLEIPYGATTTYGDIAAKIHNPQACRAVGSAVGANPVAYIIPCHRVICSTGEIGNYHWGKEIKVAMLKGEQSLR